VKLLNKSVIYLSIFLLFIISVWMVIFYFNMLSEIKGSVDEGLDNYKRQIIYKAKKDSTILTQHTFDEGFFSIVEITQKQAYAARDLYIDTLMYMQDADDEEEELEPVRILTTAFKQGDHYYELRIINSMVEEDDLQEALLRGAIWLYITLVASIIIINNFVLKRLWRPFYSLLNQLKNYRLGNSKNLPKIKTSTKEFVDLQNAVDILLKHSSKTYEQQKQFIGNAAHELQTPLAIATNKLELLLETMNLENQQAQSISEVLQIIERLIRLNKSLLLLAKIENKQFFDNQAVSINSIIKQNLTELEEFSEFKNITTSITESTELSVEMDASLANIIISNLIQNAVFHNETNGSIIITISINSIKICNTGKQEPLNAEKIFNRFYKPDPVPSGTGLGLAIVKAICSLYGFVISYQYEENNHCFELSID
jgi:two-component system sensor histidine kinase QseC